MTKSVVAALIIVSAGLTGCAAPNCTPENIERLRASAYQPDAPSSSFLGGLQGLSRAELARCDPAYAQAMAARPAAPQPTTCTSQATLPGQVVTTCQ